MPPGELAVPAASGMVATSACGSADAGGSCHTPTSGRAVDLAYLHDLISDVWHQARKVAWLNTAINPTTTF
jgi:hypothetical protein